MRLVLVGIIAIVMAIATQSVCGRIADKFGQDKLTTYTWRINLTGDKLSENVLSLDSPLFPATGYPYQAKARFQLNNRMASVSLAFIDDDNIGEPIPFTVLPEVTYTLKDQKGTGKDLVRRWDYELHSTLQFNSFLYKRDLKGSHFLVGSVYNVSNSIVIDIAIEPPSVANAIASSNGTFAGTIDHYSLRKQRQIDGLEFYYLSPYFYTSPGGFRVTMAMFLNGLGSNEGIGLTAEIVFLTGENDDNLGRSFPHKATIVLFNQLDSSKHFVASVKKDITAKVYYYVDLLPFYDLENDGFLKDDTLYYKVIIQPSTI